MSVLEPVFNQVCVEKVYMSEDVQKANPAVLAQVRKLIGDIPIEFMSHMDFKEKTHTSNAIIRTGECTPFANVMLQITVDFS
jgi:D-ribose pyranase